MKLKYKIIGLLLYFLIAVLGLIYYRNNDLAMFLIALGYLASIICYFIREFVGIIESEERYRK